MKNAEVGTRKSEGASRVRCDFTSDFQLPTSDFV